MNRNVMWVMAGLAMGAGNCFGQAGLFVGQDSAGVMTKTTSMDSFPSVSWVDGEEFEVGGAAASPDGILYLVNGAFTNYLYAKLPGAAPAQLSTLTASGISGLGYVNGKLYGFANFASPMGIYEIEPTTGQCTLRMSTADSGLRFFALDGNALDGKLYGFSEYGQSGLHVIDPATWTTHRLAATPPGSYGMCRGMAVGDNIAYLVATHPTDTYYAYDLEQGDNGTYVPFENPYPDSLNGGGAWYDPSITPPPPANDECGAAQAIGEGNSAFSTLTATTDGSSGCGGYNDVWFTYTPTRSFFAVIGTCGGAAADTIVSVYDGCGGTELACNDDNCGVQSSVSLAVTAGVPLTIRVAGWSDTDRGAGTLSITECQGPTVTTQPQSQSTCASLDPNAYVILRADATASGEVTYQWFKDGDAVFDGPTSWGSTINGSSFFRLLILSPGPADAGVYTCVVTSMCDGPLTATTDEAVLSICGADFNCDGFLDFFDYGDYVACFEGTCGAGQSADYNRDGFVDFFDYSDFVTGFEAGC